MRLQTVITIVTGVLTVVFVILAADAGRLGTVSALPSGSVEQVIGALVFLMTGFGLGWVNVAADYSRYLPRTASSGGVVGWTTFGASVAPVVLLVFGLLLAGSSTDLSDAIADDPIGALAAALPTWFLVPFALVAVLGLVGGAVLDIYSSGLALLSLGLRIPRWSAALRRRRDHGARARSTSSSSPTTSSSRSRASSTRSACPSRPGPGSCSPTSRCAAATTPSPSSTTRTGRYGDVRWSAVALVVVATVLGWGLVTQPNAAVLTWQGYLLGPFGLGGRDGAWAYANLGVLVALAVGFVGTLLLERARIRAHEAVSREHLVVVDMQRVPWRTRGAGAERSREPCFASRYGVA